MTHQVYDTAQAAFPFVIAQGRNIETQVYRKRYPAYNYALVVRSVLVCDADRPNRPERGSRMGGADGMGW